MLKYFLIKVFAGVRFNKVESMWLLGSSVKVERSGGSPGPIYTLGSEVCTVNEILGQIGCGG